MMLGDLQIIYPVTVALDKVLATLRDLFAGELRIQYKVSFQEIKFVFRLVLSEMAEEK